MSKKVEVYFYGRKAGALGTSCRYTVTVLAEEPIREDEIRKAVYDAGYEHVSSVKWRLSSDR